MSAILANWANQSSGPPAPEPDATPLDLVVEPRPFEPRRIHVSRPLVWVFLVMFSLTIVALGVWGLGHSTLTYGAGSLDRATTERLARIQSNLREANAPEAALRRMAIVTQPGVNIGDAIEALADTEKALEPMSNNAVIASALAELRTIRQDMRNRYYGGYSGPTPTPLATLPLTLP